VGVAGVAEGMGLLRGQVDGDDAVGAGRGGVAAELLEALGQERIVVAHEDKWRLHAPPAQRSHDV
jgi:hypothetical protein